jgi:predicted signal transduction protein with EAL and GGDEF domain
LADFDRNHPRPTTQLPAQIREVRGEVERGEVGIGFISLAEEIGLIVPIGKWVVETACTQNAQWQKNGLTSMPGAN